MIFVNEPLFLGNEKKYLQECIDTTFISSEGPFVKRFEEMFAEFIGTKHAVSVCNGTVAIEIALRALGIGPGDEVILPSFTIISCIMAVLRLGATPILVDSEAETWNMDIEQVKSKITDRTKVVMPVHIYGHPVDMKPLLELSEKHGFYILEDAAEVHGAEYNNKKCGSFGEMSTFSFYANKIVTTGEGGMILTNNDRLAEKLESLRNLCFKREKRFVHEELGYNFRMTNLQAAVGVAQMEYVDKAVQRKTEQGKLYSENLSRIKGISLQKIQDNVKAVYWVNGFLINDDIPFDAVRLAKKLLEKGVQTRPFFWPLHQQPVLNNMGLFNDETYPVSEKLARRGLYLPSGMALKDEQILEVCKILNDIMSGV